MNARFLASTGGRFAHAAVSLAFALAAYASFSDGGPNALRCIALGTVAITAGFIVAAVLSVAEFAGYSLAIGVLAPMAGFYYFTGLELVIGRGSAVGSSLGAMAAFFLLAGIVIGLVPSISGKRARRPIDGVVTANVRA
jgi:hypothetical protein